MRQRTQLGELAKGDLLAAVWQSFLSKPMAKAKEWLDMPLEEVIK